MHVNLFIKVGRNPRECVGTYPDTASAQAAQAMKSVDLERSGVARERMIFTVETVKGKKE